MDILVKNGSEIQPVGNLSCKIVAYLYSSGRAIMYERNLTVRDLMLAGF